MNFNTFNVYYEKAGEAKKIGNIIEAKKQYMLAGKSMYEMALNAEGDLKTALIHRAENVIKIADNMTDTSISSPTVKTPKPIVPSLENEDIPKFVPAVVPDISFDDVAGLEEVKQAIQRRIINPMKHLELYKKFKAETGGGVLMYGPPGTGKTMIAKAIAHEVNAKFFSIRCSDIVGKWFGEAERNIKELFNTARNEKSAVIFFDEFDSISPNRSYVNSSVMPRVVNELLSQIDGFSKSENTLLLLAATNRPWEIDSGVTRSKRFSEKLYIPLPDLEARKYIIIKNLEGIPQDDNIDYYDLAEKMEGFNGADVAEFCNRCRDFVLERSIQLIESGGNYEDEKITKNDIYETLKNFKSSVQKQDLDKFKKYMEQYDLIK